MAAGPTITGYSTALFATWYFIEEYGLLFDCGDGVSSHLLQKARKIKQCFVSHPDRDHVTGLLQFLQLNGRDELTVYYPMHSGSFPALADFTAKFDPHITGSRWVPIAPSEVALRNNLVVRAFTNRHVATNKDEVKSLSFAVDSVRRKLKPEFAGLSPQEIAAVRSQRGSDGITDEVRVTEIIYSADTPIETDGRYHGAKILIHEATFLTRAEIEPDNPRRNKHSSLDAVMEMVADSDIGTLILGHFSSRYEDEQIDEAIDREARRCGVKIPIERVYPGKLFQSKCRVGGHSG
ncbi:MAG: MBL fold metallo-hydrolase [Pirellulaceae bacterium]|nr:MBL fold metallo-hydrolase [Pirellulaceae bacterium]